MSVGKEKATKFNTLTINHKLIREV